MHIADDVIVRAERIDDRPLIDALLCAAFPAGDVAGRVNRTRDTLAFVPELSLVADVGDEILGYALLTRTTVDNVDGDILALGPVAVAPVYQRKMIGMVLVKSALRFAEIHRFAGVVVGGAESYFHRFGFRPVKQFGLSPAFDLNCGDALLAMPLAKADFAAEGGIIRFKADVYPL